MQFLIFLWLLSVLAFMVGWLISINKDIKAKELYKKHLEHISAVFCHEREVVQMFRISKIRHWSVGCEELRQSTMLEE